MTENLKKGLVIELSKAKNFYEAKQYPLSFNHLERYHILSQAHYLPHLNSHWWMFKVGLKLKDLKEIAGQLMRMVGSIGSLLGKYPVGNTGGANVSPLKPMPIPEDLKQYFS